MGLFDAQRECVLACPTSRMMMRLFRLLIVLLAVVGAAGSSPASAAPPERTLRFDVTDQRDAVTRDIDSTLRLRVVRVPHSRVAHFGWEVQVVDRSAGTPAKNLLRHQTFSGGPHPTDVLAWISHERYFPDERILPVPGYPYEIRIRLIDCRTEQVGDDVGFVSWSVEVTWRRLDLAANRDRERVSRFAIIP